MKFKHFYLKEMFVDIVVILNNYLNMKYFILLKIKAFNNIYYK